MAGSDIRAGRAFVELFVKDRSFINGIKGAMNLIQREKGIRPRASIPINSAFVGTTMFMKPSPVW